MVNLHNLRLLLALKLENKESMSRLLISLILATASCSQQYSLTPVDIGVVGAAQCQSDAAKKNTVLVKFDDLGRYNFETMRVAESTQFDEKETDLRTFTNPVEVDLGTAYAADGSKDGIKTITA